jgi:deazaflavin-dependent oxidoreductase (nitroreductase family)
MLNSFLRGVLLVYKSLYRATKGRLGGRIQGLPVLLLTTTGRKTGRVRTTPLGYFEDDGRYVIIASNAGRGSNPGWFHNLRSYPQVRLQLGARRMEAKAQVAPKGERERLWARLVELAPGYAAYARRTKREIPMVVLHPEGG